MSGAQVKSVVRRTLFLAAVWLTMTGADPDALAVGAVTVAAAVWLSLQLAPERRHTVRVLRAFLLLPRFAYQSVLGGLDVARRALDPKLPLKPGWFVLPASVPEGGPRVVLGGEFSLLPGTLVAGTRDGCFLVHVLDRTNPIEKDLAAGEADLARVIKAVPQ